jgi:hypothetical protein
MGKNKEHLRLTVEDENENIQSILWWGGAGSELPEEGSKFDVAYSLRASSFRGNKQVTLQFEELRIVEEAPAELKKHKVEIVDYRLEPAGATLTGGITKQAPAIQIWAEEARTRKGRDHFDLQPGEFAIYTAPPSSTDLRTAFRKVKPKSLPVRHLT